MHRDEPTKPRKWVWVLAVVLVTLLAFGLRWYYVSTAMVLEPVRGDAQHYVAYAWNLVHHGVFAGNLPGSASVTPSSYRDPAYPALLAIAMRTFGSFHAWYAAVLMLQALLGALTATLTMLLGRRWLDWRWALGAGLLAAVWPHNITIAGDLLTETMFGFLCMLAIWLCAHAWNRRSAIRMATAGITFGLATLTNSVLLPCIAVLLVYFAWRRRMPRRLWVTLLITALVLPAGWAVRNMNLPASDSMHTNGSRAWNNLVYGSWPSYHDAYRAMLDGNPAGPRLLRRIKDEARLTRASHARGLKAMGTRMAKHPWRYAAWYMLEKPRLLWGWRIRMGQNDIYVYPTKHSPFDTQPAMRALAAVCHTINPILAGLMLACLLLVVGRRIPTRSDENATALGMVLTLAVVVTVLYSTFQSEPRFSIPFRPFEMLLAMTALATLVNWLRHRIHASRRQLAHD